MEINTVSKKVFLSTLLIAVVFAGLLIYFYSQNVALKVNPQQVAQQEAQALLDKVGKLIVLPQGEVPTIATVVDPTQLGSQPFFANAQKGDKLILYTTAKKAILYNPTENKIVEVAPVNIGPAPAATTPAATSTKPKAK